MPRWSVDMIHKRAFGGRNGVKTIILLIVLMASATPVLAAERSRELADSTDKLQPVLN